MIDSGMKRRGLKQSVVLGLAMLSLSSIGCVQRKMVVTSDPPGALVYMNDREMGRTPFTTDFTWYGKYDVQVRKEGFETLNTVTPVNAPFWQWPPIDLLAELAPWRPTDERHIHYTLNPHTVEDTPTESLLSRGQNLAGQIESTRIPTTAPATPTMQK